ncbi:hypothetical protein B0H14DRAFT_1490591 [Mycena olivaceomarginata]|nr:hypothetical protein B0H14DRAFT_1490591 [Mycena olivaceomarginata]
MDLCSTLWSDENICDYLPNFSYNYTQILTQAPLQLIRILQACRVAPWPRPFTFCHRVLDLSWAEMREAICYLRPVIGEDKAGLWELCYYAPPSLFPDLTYDYLRAMRFIFEGGLPRIFISDFFWWGRVVRLCPPCPALLKELKAMAHHLDHWDHWDLRERWWKKEALYHAVQWLKTFPEDQCDLVLMTWFVESAGKFHDNEQRYESMLNPGGEEHCNTGYLIVKMIVKMKLRLNNGL